MDELMKIIVFKMNGQQFGLDVNQVRSIERLQSITKVPQTEDFIKGVVNLRGEITPIVELKERLSLGQTKYNSETRILIVALDNLQVGLLVDSATDVIDIDASIIESAPKIMQNINSNIVRGVAKLEENLLIILQLKYLFSYEEIQKIEEL